MLAIARRNWALRLSVVLNVCVLLYVCANIGSSGPWIEESPSNWAAPLQPETYGAVDLVNSTQKGAASAPASAASVGAVRDAAAASRASGRVDLLRRSGRLLVTTTPDGARIEVAAREKPEQPRNRTVVHTILPSVRSSVSSSVSLASTGLSATRF